MLFEYEGLQAWREMALVITQILSLRRWLVGRVGMEVVMMPIDRCGVLRA